MLFEPVRSAEPPTNSGNCGANASSAACDALRVAMVFAAAAMPAIVLSACSRQAVGQIAVHAPRELGRELGVRAAVVREARLPVHFELLAARTRVPGVS